MSQPKGDTGTTKLLIILCGVLLLSSCGALNVLPPSESGAWNQDGTPYVMPPNTVDCDNFDVTHECTVEADSNE